MKKNELFELLGEIDPELVARAQEKPRRSVLPMWMKVTTLAACAALIITASIGLLSPTGESGTTAPSVTMNVQIGSSALHHLADNITAAIERGELPFVTSVTVLEDSGKVLVTVNTDSKTHMKKLRSFDKTGKLLTIEKE